MRLEEVERLVLELSDEDRDILAWGLLGEKVRRWTEGQDLSFLLSIVTCPEGHLGAFSHFYVYGNTRLVVESDGTVVPDDNRFNKQENFDLGRLDAFYCDKCGKESIFGNFWMPKTVKKELLGFW